MMTDGDFYPSVHPVEAIILRFLHNGYRKIKEDEKRTNGKIESDKMVYFVISDGSECD
jgi:hypothetical protein